MQIASFVMIKDVAIGVEEFTQQVTIMMKVKEFPKVLRDNIIKQNSNGKSYRTIAMA